MAAAGGFPWRWVIAGIAMAVVAVTILVPPPGSHESGTGDTVQDQPPTVQDSTAEVPGPVSVIPDTVRVLVLNGTTVDGLAGRTQRMLLRSSTDSTVIMAPFDPSDTHMKPYTETVLISHVPDLSAARVIAGIMGIPDSSIVWEVPTGGLRPRVDVTVCLGDDLSASIPEN